MAFLGRKIRTTILIATISFCSLFGNQFYDFRSQGINLARDLAGWQTFMSQCNHDDITGFIALTPEYTQAFHNSHIANCLFGNSLETQCSSTPFIPIQGSLLENRNSKAWLADYFGLPTDFNGMISVNPSLKTFLIDVAGYVDLTPLARGLYISLHAPIVFTRWDLGICEESIQGTNNYPAGYFNAIATGYTPAFRGANNNELLKKALDFLTHGKVPDLGNVIMQPLTSSRFPTATPTTKIGLADIQASIGWNFVCERDYHAGISLNVFAPTGNNPDTSFIFQPIIGSGGHWKLGAGAHMHVALWRHCDETAELNFYIDGYGHHIFAARQCHSFDLCGKPNSRYMLAQRLGTERVPPILAGASNANVAFQNEFAPVANLTKTVVDVSVAVEGDIVVSFVFARNPWNATIGYEYWARTCDRINLHNPCCNGPLETQFWALKGDAQVIGFEENTNAPVCLAATESQATISAGTNGFVATSPNRINVFIDNPKAARTADEDVLDEPTLEPDHVTNTSNLPLLIKQSDIDFSGTKGSSNKIFFHVDYAWSCPNNISAHFGLGGELEFTNTDLCKDICDVGCSAICDLSCARENGTCDFCALNQWGIWIKAGVSFN